MKTQAGQEPADATRHGPDGWRAESGIKRSRAMTMGKDTPPAPDARRRAPGKNTPVRAGIEYGHHGRQRLFRRNIVAGRIADGEAHLHQELRDTAIEIPYARRRRRRGEPGFGARLRHGAGQLPGTILPLACLEGWMLVSDMALQKQAWGRRRWSFPPCGQRNGTA